MFIGDQAGEQISNDVRQYIKNVGSSLRLLEEGTPWANRAELIIGHLKAAVRKDLVTSNCPICLWYYCLERRVPINNLAAKGLFTLKGETPYTTVYGKEGDISALPDFSWYEVVYYMDQKQPFPYAQEMLGRYLGPSTGVGNEYCSWILRSNGKIVARRTVRPLTHIEQSSTVVAEKINYFDTKIKEKFGDGISGPKAFDTDQPLAFMDFDNFEVDEEFVENQRPLPQPIHDARGKTINQQPINDNLLEKEVRLGHNNEVTRGKVVGRTVGDDFLNCGTYSDNQYHNTVVYDVQFPDGSIKEYAASVLAENMVEQVDKENIEYSLFDNILDHQKRLTKGESTDADWFFKVLWKDGNEEWIPLLNYDYHVPLRQWNIYELKHWMEKHLSTTGCTLC